MTKHIVGLIIFTLIVGTSAIVAGLFGYTNAPKTFTFSNHSDNHRVYKKKKRKKRCRKRRKHRNEYANAAISQAVFNKSTNQLTTNLVFSNESFDGEVDLHFFVKDEFGTQYLKKETIDVSADISVYENSFAWLNRLESRENLYVIPMARVSKRNWDYQPRFDVLKATPVLLQSAD